MLASVCFFKKDGSIHVSKQPCFAIQLRLNRHSVLQQRFSAKRENDKVAKITKIIQS